MDHFIEVPQMSEVELGDVGQKCHLSSSRLPGSEVAGSWEGWERASWEVSPQGEAGTCSADGVPWSHHRKTLES